MITYSISRYLPAIIGVGLLLVAQPTYATTPTIEALQQRIESLRTIIQQRIDFPVTGAIEKTNDDPEYFSLEEVEQSPQFVYGNEPGVIEYRTDGSVLQLLLQHSCREAADAPRLAKQSECMDSLWVLAPEVVSGVVTFTIPVEFANHGYETLSTEIDVYACRYNGCQFEKTTTVTHKKTKIFADDLVIFDRYEWEYEWEGKTYHVQEVLLHFPDNEIRRVKLHVTCDAKGLYIKTTEDDRATCYSKRQFSPFDFGDEQIDEEGNVFNLRIETVTDNIQAKDAGKLLMEFTFINKQNSVIYETAYRPLQRED